MPLHIFLVEDSHTIRDNLIPTLEELVSARVVGYAETELEATAWLREHAHEWDVAVIDLFLRQGTGIGVLKSCVPRQTHQRLVVLSNYATVQMRERCIAAGAHAVFDKSNDIEAFLAYCLSPGK